MPKFRDLRSCGLNGLRRSARFELSRFHRLIGDLYDFAQSERYVFRTDAVASLRNLCAWENTTKQPVEFI
jgi:hypothetical protein